jgi:hypothetical protein
MSNISAININATNINANYITGETMVDVSLNVSERITANEITANEITTNEITTNEITVSDITSNSISLNVDNASISFGANSDITLTHAHDNGLNLKNVNTTDSAVVLTLQTGKTNIQENDVIGAINFQAPDVLSGTDAILVAAGIEAVSEDAFAMDNNATKLSFKTATSETATEKMSLSSAGDLTLAGDINITGDTITSTTTNASLNYQPNGTGCLRLLMNSGNSNGLQNGLIFDDAYSWKIAKGTKGSSGASLEFWHYNYNAENQQFQWNAKGFLAVNGSGQINFTGQHRNIMNTNISESSVGLIVSSTGKFINTDNTLEVAINESLPECVITTSDNDKKVFGVLSDKEDSESMRSYSSGNWGSVYTKQNNNEQRVFINSLGEGAIWVCNKNGNIENGDYITSSSIPGYGMKQADGLLHNYTVAKITCDCDFSITKIVKQKLKVISTTDASGNTTTEIDYDANGDVQYEDDLDINGNQQMIYPLKTRFLEADGEQITEEEYNTKLANEENVYIACFVGCTYHCG